MLRRADRPEDLARDAGRRTLAVPWLRRRLLPVLCLGLVVAIFVPQILSVTGTVDWLAKRAIARMPGSVEFGNIRLAWLRPVEVDRLRLHDAKGQPLAAAARVRTSRSLWRLVASLGREVGIVYADQPEVWVDIRAEGSNWEDFLASLPADRSASQRVPAQVRISDGMIHLTEGSGRTDAIREVEGWLDVPSGAASPVTFAARATHGPADGNADGYVRLQGSWQSDGPAGATADLQADLDALPLDLAHYAAIRCGQPTSPRGAASGSCQVTIRTDNPQFLEHLTLDLTLASVQVELPIANARPTEPAEILDVPRVTLKLRATARDGRTVVEECDVRSSVASLALAGRLPLTRWTARELLIDPPQFELRGQVDLAALAAQTPRAIRLRDDVQIESGTLVWELISQAAEPLSRRLKARVQSHGLAARRGADTLRLDDAIELAVELGLDGRGPFADQVRLRAPSLRLDAQGRLQEGQVEIEADLARLWQQLGQFLDLGPLDLSGQLNGHAGWQTTSEQMWQIDGELHASDLRAAGPSDGAWVDPQLRLAFQGTGRFDAWRLTELAAATLDCSAGTDGLTARLAAPVPDPGPKCQWPLEVRVHGDLARWRSRLGWLFPGELPHAAGQVTARAQLEAGPTIVQVRPFELTLKDLELVLPHRSAGPHDATPAARTGDATGHNVRRIREPSVQLAGEAVYQVTERELRCQAVTLASTSASVKAEALRLRWDPVSQLDGTFHYRADLQRLGDHFDLARDRRITGQLTGLGRLASIDGGWSVEADGQIQGFQWQQRWLAASGPAAASAVESFRTLWHEPQVRLALSGTWLAEQQRLSLTAATYQSPALAVHLSGSVDTVPPRTTVELHGRSNLNWELLSEQLRPLLGAGVQLRGTVERPFWLKGPVTADAGAPPDALVPTELAGQLGLGWQSFQAYGVQGGAASLDAQLLQQTLQIAPFEIPVGQGALRLAPSIELFGPLRLVLEKGQVVDQVSITPEMCQRWLKYIAPLVAEATAAEGRLSLQVARAEVPLREPLRASIGGALTIHQAHIGPGPLAREFLTLAQTISAMIDPAKAGQAFDANARWVELPEQAIPFRVENGQVAHQNLTMQIGEVTIRTRGSVGFDQRLNLIAEVPVQDRWIAKQPYLVGLRGQTLSIPVHGTFDRPALDRRALQSLSHQAARGAARGILEQELQRQLERLLPKQ